MLSNSLIPYKSDNIQIIQMNNIMLTKELTKIENDIYNFDKAIYAFDREYQKRLGNLAETVLGLRKELAINGAKQDEFYSKPSIKNQLDKSEYLLLKASFRKAAKLCHPDHLSDHCRCKGIQLFDTLNKAYHLNDVISVEHILWLLQSGQAFSQTPIFIDDELLLNKRKELLGLLIDKKKNKLNEMRTKEEYDVSNRDNWDILLYSYKAQLKGELVILKAKVRHAKSIKPA